MPAASGAGRAVHAALPGRRSSRKPHRRLTLLALAVTAIVFMIGFCSRGGELLTFAYQDRVADAAAILAAAELADVPGFKTVMFTSGSMTAEALITGSAGAATMGDAAAAALAARYPEQIVLIGTHGGGPGRHRIVSRNVAPQRVGVKFGTSTHAALSAWLASGSSLEPSGEGLRVSPDVKLVDLSPDLQLAALAAGEIDALAASEPTPTIAASRIKGVIEAPILVPGHTFPVVLVTTRASLEKYGPLISQLIAGIAQSARPAAAAAAGQNPAAFDILRKMTGMEAELLAGSLKHHTFGYLPIEESLEELDALARFLVSEGSIPAVPDWEKTVYRPD